jgi:hypothetical protein
VTAARRHHQHRCRGATRCQNAAPLTVRHQVWSSRLFQAQGKDQADVIVPDDWVCTGMQWVADDQCKRHGESEIR